VIFYTSIVYCLWHNSAQTPDKNRETSQLIYPMDRSVVSSQWALTERLHTGCFICGMLALQAMISILCLYDAGGQHEIEEIDFK
jgi:hypothetical protein